jgi:hypothetical protein
MPIVREHWSNRLLTTTKSFHLYCFPKILVTRGPIGAGEESVRVRTCFLAIFVAFASLVAHASDQLKPVSLVTNCTLKSGSVIFSAFKDALQNSKKYELVPDLSDKGKMDVVITVRMICVEDKGNVAVASVYGLAKCFGPKNCHHSVNDSTLNALLSEPGEETQSGMNLFKGFDQALAENQGQMILNH